MKRSKKRTKLDWNDEELQKLYTYYKQKYWDGNLQDYKIRNSKMPPDCQDAIGLCADEDKTVLIDVECISSDRQLRNVVLHEMCHVAQGIEKYPRSKITNPHGIRFFEQLEMLLNKNAPITVSLPESGNRLWLDADMIPKRLRLCRREIRKAAVKYWRIQGKEIKRLEEEAKRSNKEFQIEIVDAFGEFYEVASLHDIAWRDALYSKGVDLGMVDIEGNVRNKHKAMADQARRGYRKGRRYFITEKRARILWGLTPTDEE